MIEAEITEVRAKRVLIVDHEPLTRTVLSRRLSRAGYVVDIASEGSEALEKLSPEPPDIVLLDLIMPGLSGLEVLDEIRARPATARLPVILVSSLRESEFVVDGLAHGASDFVGKPVDPAVLLARLQTQLRFAETLRKVEMQAHLLEQLAAVDALTGTLNRRSMDAALKRETRLVERGQRTLSVLLLDIDHFKNINDTHGHRAGDAVLAQLAARATTVLRASDQLCRFGGEEFCAILPETSLVGGMHAAARLLHAMASAPFEHEGVAIRVTLSLGLASIPAGQSESPESLIGRADAALYAAKHGGRNRLHLHRDGACHEAVVGPGAPS